MDTHIHQIVTDSIKATTSILEPGNLESINRMVVGLIACFNSGHKLLLCGNGGSASDAQHLAAEFSGRFQLDRKALPAEALHVNTSFITAVANDYGYDKVYGRAVEAFGKPGDILLCLTTSGNSKNIIEAAAKAKEIGLDVYGFTGQDGGMIKEYCHEILKIHATQTARIQEAHIAAGHILCELVEKALFVK
jgi:D-sedoheptulose 7-phosphate isomerase